MHWTWPSGVSLKRALKMQLRGVDLRSVGHSSPKLWPKIDFWKFPQLHPVLKTFTPGFWFPWCKWVNSYIFELRGHNSTRKHIVLFIILSLIISHVLVNPPLTLYETPFDLPADNCCSVSYGDLWCSLSTSSYDYSNIYKWFMNGWVYPLLVCYICAKYF